MSNVSKTKTLMIYDETSAKEIATIRLHSVADEFVTEGKPDEKFVVSSVWKNKDFDFSQLRVESEGKTYFNYAEGIEISANEVEQDTTSWNEIEDNNTVSTLIV